MATPPIGNYSQESIPSSQGETDRLQDTVDKAHDTVMNTLSQLKEEISTYLEAKKALHEHSIEQFRAQISHYIGGNQQPIADWTDAIYGIEETIKELELSILKIQHRDILARVLAASQGSQSPT